MSDREDPISTHFFTGYPGFLGSQLLPRVLERAPAARALCLVQPKYRELAAARLGELELAAPRVAARVELVEGDIASPALGLDGEAQRRAAEATEVWHLAAVYDLSVARDTAERVNVQGTRNVVDLARRCPSLDRLHYLSTCYVSGRYAGVFGEEDLVKGQAFNNHYEETKYRAELEVREAIEDGLPATIYRPAIVVGDSRTGETQKYDGPYYLMQWILRQPGAAVVPTVGDPSSTRVNLVPSDFVIDAVAHLSRLPHSVGKTYQLADREPLTVAELLEVLEHATGKRLKRIPVPLEAARWTIDRVPGVGRWIRIPSATLDYFVHPTHYTVDQARADLGGSGIEVPPFPSYATRLVDFMRSHPEVGSRAMA